jgi:hypothetical protein
VVGWSILRPPSLIAGQPHASATPRIVPHIVRPLNAADLDYYNEICEIIYGSKRIHPHHLGLLTSSIGPFGQAKHCVINAFDTNYLMSADEFMANILHLAQNMEEELPGTVMPAPRVVLAPPHMCLSQLDVGHTVTGATPTVAAAAEVDYPTSALAIMAVSTTSCRPS